MKSEMANKLMDEGKWLGDTQGTIVFWELWYVHRIICGKVQSTNVWCGKWCYQLH